MNANATGAPRAVIIGTGRSGTGYMSRLITGWTGHTTCGHEAWFRAVGAPEPGFDIDASWLALPHLEDGTWDGPAVHVVRDPVATVRSLLRTEFFGLIADTPYPAFAMANCKAAADALAISPVAAAVEFWAHWNARCAAVAQLTIRLEDISDFDGGELSIGAATLGLIEYTLDIEFGPWQGPAALPTNINHDGPQLVTTDLALDVDEAYVWDRLGARAAAFGYGRS